MMERNRYDGKIILDSLSLYTAVDIYSRLFLLKKNVMPATAWKDNLIISILLLFFRTLI